MSSGAVLDASAVAALLFDEPGAAAVAEQIATGSAAISTVNLSEVAALLVRRGRPVRPILPALAAQVAVEPFGAGDGYAAAELFALTRAAGLSFGDRACLALAARRGGTALTADSAWLAVRLPVQVRSIRA
ncbi:MAG: type II toxin-antitoxin system VapC family toxin [Pseudonocardia sp.]